MWLGLAMLGATPPLTITDSGFYLTYVDPDGVPSLAKIDTVVDLTLADAPAPEPPPVVPDDPDPPPAQTPTQLDISVVKDVQAWATAIDDPQGSQAVAAVYDHVKGAFNDGLLTDANVWIVLKKATDDALTITSAGKSWATFRTKLSSLITEGRQRGTLASKSQVTRMLASAKQGLDMSADGTAALTDAQLVAIAVKTNEAIDAQ